MKFKEMPYARPDTDAAKQALTKLLDSFRSASSTDEAYDSFLAFDKLIENLSTQASIAFIRNSLDTTDEFYDKERNFWNEYMPELQEIGQQSAMALLESPHRAALEEKLGGVMFRNAEIALKSFSPEIITDLQEENRITTEYDKLIASAQIEFDGKTLTLAQLTPYHQNVDVEVRQKSIEARANWFMSHAQTLDEIFDKLVKIRDRMAKKLGYDNYIQLGYYQMTRNCYDKDMVSAFRDGVRKYLVPVAARLKKEQAERIGVTDITMRDDAFEFPTGNAKPVGTPEDIFAHGKTMYHELSSDTAEFIDFMLENDLFDVLTRPGKSGGGYCADIPDYKSPFIFANFNGTSGDIDVLTHEAGHAFASYVSRDVRPSQLREYTYETAEVHSMSMEFFTWPWMEGFFGDATGKYRYSHLSGALTFIPYGAMVDHFQHEVYQHPDMAPAERNELWLRLESQYRPYLKLEGTPFYGEGRRWQAQSHIYERPFYYIDYCLAQTAALEFWALDQKDHSVAWSKYRRFVGFAGTKTFTDLMADAGLESPFVPETLGVIAAAAVEWLDQQPKYE